MIFVPIYLFKIFKLKNVWEGKCPHVKIHLRAKDNHFKIFDEYLVFHLKKGTFFGLDCTIRT